MPTVNELYGATSGVLTVINDPNLQPEKSWTGELSWTRERGGVRLRATGFYEAVRDSLYSERTAVGSTIVTRIVNVGRIVTPGVELALDTVDRLIDGLSLSASLTWADSRIRENAGYATVPGDTIGKYQPRVPEWRATLLASYRMGEHWNATLGSRYSGTQYSTLDNSDPNGYAYQGASPYFTMDARLHYQSAGHWSAAFGIENLNNDLYWNFHPYPQRTFSAELRYDL
jgi:iron complex outermembrane receptor protein